MTKNENYMLVSIDDDGAEGKTKALAEVLSSSTCKKIINYLAEVKEASQKDISDKLKIPLNTIEYNIKKLLSTGFIRKRKNFFWSKKGKKIIMYELSRKSIIISHKKKVSEKIKSILPAFIIASVGSFAIWAFEKIKSGAVQKTAPSTLDGAIYATAESLENTVPSNILTSSYGTPLWAWFLAGSLITILIISIVNWRKL